jgi:hypothetical protein
MGLLLCRFFISLEPFACFEALSVPISSSSFPGFDPSGYIENPSGEGDKAADYPLSLCEATAELPERDCPLFEAVGDCAFSPLLVLPFLWPIPPSDFLLWACDPSLSARKAASSLL